MHWSLQCLVVYKQSISKQYVVMKTDNGILNIVSNVWWSSKYHHEMSKSVLNMFCLQDTNAKNIGKDHFT